MVIAVDFDDTLCAKREDGSKYRMGKPTEGAILAMRRLQDEGHTLIIFTARNVQIPAAYKAVEDWLIYFKIPYHGITNIKRPEFEVYIDDRALRFTTWVQALSDLRRLTSDMKIHNYPV